MKKKLIFPMVLSLLVAVSLVGCGGKKADDSSSLNTEESTTSQKSSTSKSKESGSSTKSEESSTTASSSSAKEELSTDKQLKKMFPRVALPTNIANLYGAKTSAVQDSDNLTISYYVVDSPVSVNDKSLDGLPVFASYEKKTYGTTEQAITAVNQVDPSGVPVSLSHGFTGYKQGAAGSTYVAWREGNWAISVRGTNQNNEDAVGFSNEVINQLESTFLPPPELVGQMNLFVSSDNSSPQNMLIYQVGNVVYTMRNTSVRELLNMAASTN
ncbi:MAG: hypothetical protein LBM95_05050 [Lactobacillales bacterium]|jgi:hypothetical protein|nr:hypothetical protein [Lactobacillales bacterium]